MVLVVLQDTIYHAGTDGWKKLSGDDVVELHYKYHPVVQTPLCYHPFNLAAVDDSEWIAWIQKHQHRYAHITEKTSVSGHDIIIKSIQSWKRDLYSMNGTARKARH
ncbi:unnamed protein product [Musa banksii]